MDTEAKPGCGEQLKTARNAHQLSIEDAAKKLNLPTARIREIEEDNFDDSVSIAFYRGYIRSYASLLNLNPSVVLESFNQIHGTDIEISSPQRLRSFNAKRKEVTTRSRIFKWISFIFLVVILGLVGWGLKNKFKSTMSSESSNEVSESSSFLPELNSVEDDVDRGSSRSENTSSIVENESGSNATLKQLEQQIKAREQSAKTVNNDSSTEVEPTDESSSSIEESAITSQTSDSVTSESQPGSTNDELIFTFVGDCWVEIKDATGEVLAVGIKESGKVMTLSGEPPFKVVLGDPSVVRLQHNKQVYDLSTYRAGQVARFTVE